MVTAAAVLLDKLQELYDQASQATSPKLFFLTLFEILREYDTNPILEPVPKVILAMSQQDTAQVTKLGKKSVIEMEKTYLGIEKLIQKTIISDPRITQAMKEYQAFNENRVESTAGPIAGRHSEMCRVLSLLSDLNLPQAQAFISRVSLKDSEGRIIKWKFAPNFDQWEMERQRLERVQITTVWYSWDKLAYFYQIFKDYEKIKNQQIENNQYLSLMGLSLIYEELTNILDDKSNLNKQPRYFDINDFKGYIQKVFYFTRSALLKTVDVKQPVGRKPSWHYDVSSGLFTIESKSVKLKPHDFRGQTLGLISRNEKNQHKNWSWDEVYSTIEGISNPNNKAKLKVYYAFKGINEYIASKTGINDFLSFTTKTGRINPKYLD